MPKKYKVYNSVLVGLTLNCFQKPSSTRSLTISNANAVRNMWVYHSVLHKSLMLSHKHLTEQVSFLLHNVRRLHLLVKQHSELELWKKALTNNMQLRYHAITNIIQVLRHSTGFLWKLRDFSSIIFTTFSNCTASQSTTVGNDTQTYMHTVETLSGSFIATLYIIFHQLKSFINSVLFFPRNSKQQTLVWLLFAQNLFIFHINHVHKKNAQTIYIQKIIMIHIF